MRENSSSSFLSIRSVRNHARECLVGFLSVKQTEEFIEQLNHLQIDFTIP